MRNRFSFLNYSLYFQKLLTAETASPNPRYRRVLISFLVLANMVITFFLIFWKSPHLGLGDDGIYIRAGERLMNQDDLYKDGFRSGPLGAVFMFNLWRIFPSGGAWVVFQIIYIISVIFLCLLLTRNRSAEIRLLISFFAISAAPMREHLHNHQISSLVILFCLWP